MAQFCTKCGAPLPEGMRFCTGCGATIGEPSPPSAAAPVAAAPPVMPPSAAPVPVVASATPGAGAPAAKSGSPVIKIVLIIVGVLILFVVLIAVSCVYGIYRAKQKIHSLESQYKLNLPIPTGTREVRTQPTAPAEAPGQENAPVISTGVPIYPGASAKEGGGEMSMGAGGIKVQQYSTPDSVDKVAAFYKDKLGSKAMVSQSGGSALVQVVGTDGVINITIAPEGDSGKTIFTITSIAK